METYFDSFHEDEQISENSYLPTVDEVTKDQLGVLESIKADENNGYQEEPIKNQYLIGKEDFHQIMSDWQQHVGLLKSIDNEDLGLRLDLGLDCSEDALNMDSTSSLFEEKESLLLSKALQCPTHKSIVNDEPNPNLLRNEPKKELIIENLSPCNRHFENCQKLCELIKSETSVIGKVTLLNGEKEIFGKNIVGLHCLNEIKENPDENCQVTSTIINGKRYKIIIKPKSLKVKKLSNEKIKKTLIKKLLQCNLVTKMEPKEDEIISEMRNGNYDVPILGNDMLPNWDLMNLDSSWNMQLGNDADCVINEPKEEPVKKVPPLRIKVPKLKRSKKKVAGNKSDEEVDVETVSDKVVEGSNLSSLLKNFEDEVAKLQNEKVNFTETETIKTDTKKTNKRSDNIKSSLPKEMIERIEALKRKKDCRIPLIQAIPSKKASKCCTRMQDAVATMNRNKLLKIVSGGDTISLDHDYCSNFNKKNFCNKQIKKSNSLSEKNPKKDSGMESGDVSDTSEGANTPESLKNTQSNNANNRLLIDGKRFSNEQTNSIKAEKNNFESSCSSVSVKVDVNNSDLVKTKTVSNGNKALTNNIIQDSNSDCTVTVPSDTKLNSENKEEKEIQNKANCPEGENCCLPDKSEIIQSERPKRKLKLEEYLSRRNVRDKEKNTNATNAPEIVSNNKLPSESDWVKSSQNIESSLLTINPNEHNPEKFDECREKNVETMSETKSKKFWQKRSRRSSSTSSGSRRECRRQSRSRSKSRSRSRSHWRSSSSRSSRSSRSRSSRSSNHPKRQEGRGKHRSRWSVSRERRLDFWSGSLSRSPSRESSTSSDCNSHKQSRNSSRYQRKSRSRSSSPSRSQSRNRNNRGYSNRPRRDNYYYHNNSNKRRSRSPFYAHSMREKQRQIEERRVIYVGRIEEGMTNAKLRKRFSVFGPIIDISLHFREYGDNYGFVTYAYKADAYNAVEHGNDDPSLPHYDLCFGGRRGFCKEKYADLDGMPTSYSGFNDTPVFRGANDSFDLLLKEAQAKLKNRKKQ